MPIPSDKAIQVFENVYISNREQRLTRPEAYANAMAFLAGTTLSHQAPLVHSLWFTKPVDKVTNEDLYFLA